MTSAPSPLSSSSTLEHFEHGINRIALSLDGQYIATSDVDMNVVVRKGGEIVFSRDFTSESEKIRPTDRIRGLCFSGQSEFLYVASGDQLTAIRVDGWETAWSYEAPRSFGFLIISPIALDASANGDVIAAFDNGSIVVFDAKGLKKSVIRDNDSPRWLRSANGGETVIGSDSFSLCSWDPQNRKCKARIRLAGRAFGMDANPTGMVAATRTLQDVVLWDLAKRDILQVIPVEPGIPVLRFHPQEDLLAFGERNRIKLVNFRGECVQQFNLDVASALSLAFAPSGEELFIGCTEGKLIRQALS